MNFLPITKLGKVSIGLTVAFYVLIIAVPIIVAITGQGGGDKITDNLGIGIAMISAMVSAIVSSIIGGIAVWKKSDRSILVYVSIANGLFIAFLLVGELAVPH